MKSVISIFAASVLFATLTFAAEGGKGQETHGKDIKSQRDKKEACKDLTGKEKAACEKDAAKPE